MFHTMTSYAKFNRRNTDMSSDSFHTNNEAVLFSIFTMSKNENNCNFLESIIKVEPEKFQDTSINHNYRQSADNILKLKANM